MSSSKAQCFLLAGKRNVDRKECVADFNFRRERVLEVIPPQAEEKESGSNDANSHHVNDSFLHKSAIEREVLWSVHPKQVTSEYAIGHQSVVFDGIFQVRRGEVS